MKLQSRRGLPHLTTAGNEAVMPLLTPQLKHKSLIADANYVICACSSPDRDHVVYLLILLPRCISPHPARARLGFCSDDLQCSASKHSFVRARHEQLQQRGVDVPRHPVLDVELVLEAAAREQTRQRLTVQHAPPPRDGGIISVRAAAQARQLPHVQVQADLRQLEVSVFKIGGIDGVGCLPQRAATAGRYRR